MSLSKMIKIVEICAVIVGVVIYTVLALISPPTSAFGAMFVASIIFRFATTSFLAATAAAISGIGSAALLAIGMFHFQVSVLLLLAVGAVCSAIVYMTTHGSVRSSPIHL